MLIAYLDAVDGDPDLEDDGQDCCSAGDDAGTTGAALWALVGDLLPGDPGDAEADLLDHPARSSGDPASQDLADHPAFRHLFWRSA